MDDEIGPWDILAFFCELAMLAALAVGGWNLARHWLDAGPILAGVCALALCSLAAGVWGLWLAPRASHRPGEGAVLAGKAAVFVVAGVVVALPPGHGHPWWGAALVLVSVTDLGVVELRRHRIRRSGAGRDA